MIFYKNQLTGRQRFAFHNKLRVNYKKYQKEVIKAAASWKKEIKKLTSFDDIKKLKKDDDLEKTLGQKLADIIIISFYLGNKRSRKPKKKKASNLSSLQFVSSEAFNLELVEGNYLQISNAKLPDPDELWEIDWDLEQEDALKAFKAEAFEVAGVLNDDLLTMVKDEAAQAIKDGSSFGEFKKNLKLKGFEAKNPYHLKTNFNTAVNNSYLAADWLNMEKNKDFFPYLRYVGILDDRIRDEHEELHGTILPVDDPFWDKHYPPNGWNCRCDVEQLTKDEAESDKKFEQEPPAVKVDPNFAKNTGKDKTIWGDWLKEKT